MFWLLCTAVALRPICCCVLQDQHLLSVVKSDLPRDHKHQIYSMQLICSPWLMQNTDFNIIGTTFTSMLYLGCMMHTGEWSEWLLHFQKALTSLQHDQGGWFYGVSKQTWGDEGDQYTLIV